MAVDAHHINVEAGRTAGPKTPEIARRFEVLDERVAKLGAIIETLLDRIDVVMTPSIPEGSGSAPGPVSPVSESKMSAHIHGVCERIENIADRVHNANRRLAL